MHIDKKAKVIYDTPGKDVHMEPKLEEGDSTKRCRE